MCFTNLLKRLTAVSCLAYPNREARHLPQPARRCFTPLQAIAGFADNLKIRLTLQKCLNPAAEKRVVVNQQNTNHYLVPSTCFIRQPEEALYLLTSILAAGYGFSTHTFDQGLLSQWPKGCSTIEV